MNRRRNIGAFLLLGAAILLTLIMGRPSTVEAQPPIPHAIAPGVDCLVCHGSGGAKAVPSNHIGLPQDQCASCHELVLAQPVNRPPIVNQQQSAAPQPIGVVRDPASDCLSCHGNPGLVKKLPDGETASLYVNGQEEAESAHGDKITCLGCHKDSQTFPHPTKFAMSSRDYSLASYDLCRGCHFDQYTKALDSVHYRQLAGGNKNAPVCTDCHGAHNVSAPDAPRPKISQTCAECHEKITLSYANSVHGKALVEENNLDVPICTDCHGVHNIHDPRTAQFRVDTPDMCSNCHSNEILMSKYGISSMVERTYLEDFHGVTINFYKKQGAKIWPNKAVCTDCHGIHDIQPISSPQSPVIKENLVTTCQQCHPGATTNFPDAWLQHYEPSPIKWPVVYYARVFYNIAIPLMVGGLMLHIGLDLAKTLKGRAKRRM